MRKAIVYKSGQTGQWAICLGDHVLEPRVLLGHTPTHAEAMFLAQLLADPHEYIRAVGEAAWEAGFDGGEKDAFSHQTFNEPCIPNPYQEEDQ